MKYVAIYARISRDDLSDEEMKLSREKVLSLSKIKDRIKTLTTEFEENREPDWILENVYWDIESGYSSEREDLIKMFNKVERGLINVVFIKEIGRVARDPLISIPLINLAEAQKIELYSLRLGKYETKTRQMWMFDVFYNDAEYHMTKDRYKIETLSKAKQGFKLTGVPLGYKMIDKIPIVQEKEADIVKKMFQLALKGESLNNIAKKHNMGYTTVKQILMNKTYIGINVYGKYIYFQGKRIKTNDDIIEVPGNWESIIDHDTFYSVQEIIEKRSFKKIRITDNEKYLLGGVVFCYCGWKLYGTTLRNNQYYVCSNKKICRCKMKRADVLEKEVIKKIEDEISNLDHDVYDPNSKIRIRLNQLLNDNIKLENDKNDLAHKFIKVKNNDFMIDKILEEQSKIDNSILSNTEEIKRLQYILSSEQATENKKDILKKVIDFYYEKDRIKLKKLLQLAIEVRFENNYRFEIYFL